MEPGSVNRGINLTNIQRFKLYFVVAALFLMLSAGSATARRISVGAEESRDYTSIQAAVNAAERGDIIYVYSGFYRENVDLDKEITLRSITGRPEYHTVKAKDPNDYVFHIRANNVTISGFSIKGALNPKKAGVYLENTRGVLISNNNISENCLGIFLENAEVNLLNLNRASENEVGILLKSSKANLLMNNRVDLNSLNGIFLKASDQNRLNGNILSLNQAYGLFLSNSSQNLIYDNYFCNAANLGYSGKNLENTWNISKSRGISIAGGPYQGGNYWTTPKKVIYAPDDLNKDGISDISYNLGNGNFDHMPLLRSERGEQSPHLIASFLFAFAFAGLILAVYITKKVLEW